MQTVQTNVKKSSPNRRTSGETSLEDPEVLSIISNVEVEEVAHAAESPKKADGALGNTMRAVSSYNPALMSPFEDTEDELVLHEGDVSLTYLSNCC